jgi:hypothetical protein
VPAHLDFWEEQMVSEQMPNLFHAFAGIHPKLFQSHRAPLTIAPYFPY